VSNGLQKKSTFDKESSPLQSRCMDMCKYIPTTKQHSNNKAAFQQQSNIPIKQLKIYLCLFEPTGSTSLFASSSSVLPFHRVAQRCALFG